MAIISVVLPTFNGSRYLGESIESVIAQTFYDWELIIVDDGSTDETPGVIQSFEKRDKRIRGIRCNKNGGLPNALNTGIRAATGKYFTWTSDDNMYLRDALMVMYDYLEKNTEIPMVCTNMIWVDNEAKILHEHSVFSNSVLLVKDVVGACFLYRRDVVNKIGEYNADKFLVEDYDYWIRIRKHYGVIGYLPGVFYIYRQHEKSLTGKNLQLIRNKNAKLLAENIDWILSEISVDKRLILELYESLKRGQYEEIGVIKNYLIGYIPELSHEKELPQNGEIIVFGNGFNGRKCLEMFGDRVRYYTTSACEKETVDESGISIIPVDKAIEYCNRNGYSMLVSPGSEHRIEIITILVERGLDEYSLFIT